MFICNAALEFSAGKKIAALSAEEYADLRACVSSSLAKSMPADYAAFSADEFRGWHDAIMDDGEVEAFTRAGIEVAVKSIRGLSTGHAHRGRDPVVQHLTQISLANVGLLEVQFVTVIEDACTDALQGMLDDGWRILAVCPPKDSRRPSYVLGRRDKQS